MRWQRHPWIVLGVLLGIHVLAHVDRNMLLGFSPQITQDLGISNAQYGFLVGTVWVLSFGVMAMFMGTLADRHSRPRVIAAGMAVWSVCTWASGQAHSFEQMVLARFFIASGEAALVPASVAMLTDLFPEQRRGTAIGVFFMGIPLGVGISFTLAGTVGASLGWRETFHYLGYLGVLVAVPLAFVQERRDAYGGSAGQGANTRGAPFAQQMQALLRILRQEPALWATIIGFVLVHLMFASLAFAQIWLVGERGVDNAAMATRIGVVQLLCGALGAVVGGGLGDKVARRMKGGHATFAVLIVACCAPPMLLYRVEPPGSVLFYLGMAAGAFMPLAVYGSANSLIQSMVPASMRSTITGFTMMMINVFAIAIGSVAIGAGRDVLGAAGAEAPFTIILLGVDMLAISAIVFFSLASQWGQGLRMAK